MQAVKIIECPRDAMQGIKTFIPTEQKVHYMNMLLKSGFDTLDFGSFVSPKAIPQMRDTAEVLSHLDLSQTNTKLLAIVANERGTRDAVQFDAIDYLGYPFSVSEIFQMRNTGKTIEESVVLLDKIINLAHKHGKAVVTYLSMGFGNPYGERWNADLVSEWVERLNQMGVEILSLSDTIGSATPEDISYIFSQVIPAFPQIEFGAHLHTHPKDWFAKVDSAYQSGCHRFDGAIKGFGGCPMAKDDLTGNMPTEKLLSYFSAKKADTGIDTLAFESAINKAMEVFGMV
ncbi:MAG: hydroxymethylglutaryl-CoA lyase [Flavobacteriales bacterium]|nr:MAG: hydroxymethylglutaryl-CoA lyase [Flavobacteriales bacterium]